ncbi:MAG: zinc-dependent alcohol dehydrogenase family protein [Chitinophagaceae bacterium]
MKAACYESFKGPIGIKELPDPQPGPEDVVIAVKATGLCRSDWHGWQGHDTDIRLPHVPGHELAGVIVEKGRNVKHWHPGDRVTVPFCGGCGTCGQCKKDQQQICDNYYQPGFTGWGSFAEKVLIRYADTNLVRLPDKLDYTQAAVLGCRFITSWRGLTAQGNVKEGDWVAIHGCGGIGLSALLIAVALGARTIAIDIDEQKLQLARSLGATSTLNARSIKDIPETIRQLTSGGADLSLDGLGSRETCRNSILCLRKQGKHIQLGLLIGEEADPPLPMSAVIGRELQIIGSHGMQAHQYPGIFSMIEQGRLDLKQLIGQVVTLEQGIRELENLNAFSQQGITIISFEKVDN